MGVDLSRSPYYDDFSADDNYYQVLFRPSTAVQTRELNQLQSILQDQIAKFGRNILKDGTIVEGCPFSIDNRYTFVKINDTYANGTAFTITNFGGLYLQNINGLSAIIVDTMAGFQSQDPYTNTLYIKYLNSVIAPNGQQQSVFSNSEPLTLLTSGMLPVGNITVLTPNIAAPNSVATGVAYAFSCGEGTIFKDNFFINVRPQTIVVDPFDNFPDGVVVGFLAAESIITPEANSELNDNSVGSTNYAAPGAHRYQLIPELTVMQSNAITNSTPFFVLASFQDGAPITIKNDTGYAIIGAEMARRTYETNGDFIVNPFLLTTEPKDGSDQNYATKDNLVCSAGLGYVKGYRAQYLNQVTVDLQKATSFVNVSGTATTVSIGSFVTVNNYCGDFNVKGLQQLEIHTGPTFSSVANNTFLDTAYDSTTKIGTAYIRGLSYVTGGIGTGSAQYEAYLFNVNTNPGYTFSQATKLVLRNVANNATLALADIIPSVANTSTAVVSVANTATVTTTNTIVSYTLQSIPQLPAVLENASAAKLGNGSIITVGGYNVDFIGTNYVFTYNPNNNTWTTLLNYPINTALSSVAALGNGSIISTGGNANLNYTATANSYRFDPDANTWTQVANMPIGIFNGGMATMANGSVLSVGGQTGANVGLSTANCYRYDPGANTWTQVANLPQAVSGQACAPCPNGSIMSMGGQTGVNGTGIINKAYRYDPGANTWTTVADMPMLDVNLVGALLGANGWIFTVGGRGNDTAHWLPPVANCFTYDPVGNTWYTAASLPIGLGENSCAPLANGCVMSIAGQTTNSSITFGSIGHTQNCYLYDWGVNQWKTTVSVPTFTTISNISVISTNTLTLVTTNSFTTGLTDASYNKLIYPLGQKAIKLDGFNNQSFVYRTSVNASFSNVSAGSMSLAVGAPIGTGSENFDSGGFLTGQATDTFIITPTQSGFTSNKPGTVNAISGNYTLGGNSTTFLSDYTSGDYIYINNTTAQINVIFSNILLTLTKPFGGTTAMVNTHCKTFPKGVPVPFDNNGSHGGRRSIVVAGNTATVTIGEPLSSPFNATAYFDVLRTYTKPIKKLYKEHVYVAINCASHPNGTKGPFSLGFVDVANINAIYVSNGTFSNTTPDFNPLFHFDNGQRDSYYDLAKIYPRSSFLKSSHTLIIDMNLYIYDQSQGVGFFNANSYPVDDANTANTDAIQTQYIPQYVSQGGHTFDLRDCIDFRSFAQNTSDPTANASNWNGTATINPSGALVFPATSHTPSPDSAYISDIQYYLPRIDKAAITTGGQLITIPGLPSTAPIAPLDSLTAMTLGNIHIPPYPSLATPDAKKSGRYDYAITVSLTQNQRYTMQDIGFLADRVEQLEYYSSLSILEEQAQKAFPQVIFQNGFVVDPFTGFTIADTLDETFNCCIDSATGIMRPALSVYTKALWTDQEHVPVNDSLVGICGCDQTQASDITSCTQQPYNYCYGRIEFQPILFCSPDFFQDPDVVTNLANNANWVNISTEPPIPNDGDWRNPYGMDWRHWRHYASNGQSGMNLSGLTDIYGNVLQDYQTRVISNTSNNPNIVNNIPGYTVDSISIDTEVLDYTRCRDVDFIARGLKASTIVRMFIGTYDVTNYVRQCQKGFAEETFNNYGMTVTTDSTGCIFGRLSVPEGIFKEGSIQVTIIDSTTNITTRADGYLQTTFTDWTHWTDIDCADQVANWEAHSGITKQYMPMNTLIVLANTPFLNARLQGNKDFTGWNTYYNNISKPTWQRFPSQAYTPLISDDWNPAYVAQDGFRSFDRKGIDVGRVSYGVVPSTAHR